MKKENIMKEEMKIRKSFLTMVQPDAKTALLDSVEAKLVRIFLSENDFLYTYYQFIGPKVNKKA